MHQNPSDEQKKLVSLVNANQRADITALPVRTFLEIETKSGSLYKLVILNPQKIEVAFFGGSEPRLQKPQIFYVQGSTDGSPSVVLHQIIRGLRLRLNRIDGGLVTTGVIVRFKITDKPDEARRIAEEVETRRPKELTAEETLTAQKKMNRWLQKTFPPTELARVKDMLSLFEHPDAHVRIIGIFYEAYKAGKLSLAFEALEEAYKAQWAYQPPTARGILLSERDAEAYNKIYLKLGFAQLNAGS